MIDPRHDPDTGRRVLQCICGATRQNITPHEALQRGWHRVWTPEGATRWRCELCTSLPVQSEERERLMPSRGFLEAAWSRSSGDRLQAIQLLDYCLRLDPRRAHIWLACVLGGLTSQKAIEQWFSYLRVINLWGEAMDPRHSSGTNEHYTPPELCDLIREVFGGPIHTDPASSALANTLVRAERFFTREDNGLALPWEGNVYCNPPGGVCAPSGRETGRPESQAAFWWAHLATRFERGAIPQAAFLIFNLELLRHTQHRAIPQPLDFAICIFKHRIRYYQRRGGRLVRGEQPTHPSALVYLGPRTDAFEKVFSHREDEFAGYVCINS